MNYNFMGYGDYIPTSYGQRKKPLTKKQLAKIQAAYAKVDTIKKYIKDIEKNEEDRTQESLKNLNML